MSVSSTLPVKARTFQKYGNEVQPAQILPGVIGISERLKVAAFQVPAIAESDATCLLMGETGTGKELFARAIHYLSPRKHCPFVPVNCGALPDQLIENELFGHTPGAYTDARSQQIGLLAYAEKGTLFLDEVDTLSPMAQVKLLRLLQEGEYRPVGSPRSVPANVRILAATNCDLLERVRGRQFREDLFYRLNVLRLTIPALRERLEDVPVLAAHFVREYAIAHGRPETTLDQAAVERLMAHAWPGNVRELQAVLRRAILLARSPVLTADDLDLPDADRVAPHEVTLKAAKSRAMDQFERHYLSDVLRRCQGNVTHAAKAAGKERRSFQRLMRKHSLAVTSFKAS